MLQNATVTAFGASELLRKNQQCEWGEGGKKSLLKEKSSNYIYPKRLYEHNLGQKVVDNFKKLSKKGFYMEKRQNLAFGWLPRYPPKTSSISESFLEFPDFL